MRALVVDDSRTTRLILKHVLSQLGFDVAEAGGGLEAFEQLKQPVQTTLVLVDWNMPDLDGIAFVRAVRADAAYRDLRILMISAEEGATPLAAALDAGADAFIPKPFTREMIQAKLDSLGIRPGQQ